jgi:hypothetical protein
MKKEREYEGHKNIRNEDIKRPHENKLHNWNLTDDCKAMTSP